MKRILKICAILTLFMALTACTQTQDNLKYQLDKETDTYILKSYTEDTSISEITIPDEFNGKPVTKIDKSAFASLNKLAILNIGKNITDIDDWGITFNVYLKEINVDAENENYSSLDGILYNKDKTILYVYPNAKSATYNELGKLISSEPVTVIDGVKEISKCAFYKCWAIEEITLPDSVEIIGERAFLKCSNLVKIDVGDGLKVIEEDAFLGCDNEEFNSIDLPDTLEKISYGAFFAAKNMKEINIAAPESQVELEDEWYPSSGGKELKDYVVNFGG